MSDTFKTMMAGFNAQSKCTNVSDSINKINQHLDKAIDSLTSACRISSACVSLIARYDKVVTKGSKAHVEVKRVECLFNTNLGESKALLSIATKEGSAIKELLAKGFEDNAELLAATNNANLFCSSTFNYFVICLRLNEANFKMLKELRQAIPQLI